MKRFQPKPYDPYREDTQTPAQRAATDRNFRIFKLRGLASFRFLLTGTRRKRLLRIVDEELKAVGAEPESTRIVERNRKLMEND